MITADVAATQALTFAIPLGTSCASCSSGASSSADRPMTTGAAGERPHDVTASCRSWCLAGGSPRRCWRALSRLSRAPGPPLRVRRGAAVLTPRRRRTCSGRPRRPVATPGTSEAHGDGRSATTGRPGRRPAASPPGAALVPRLHRRRPGRWSSPGTHRGRWPPSSGHGWLIPLEGVDPAGLRPGSLARARRPRPRSCRARATCAGRSWPPWPCGRSGSSPTSLGLSNHAFYPNFRHVAGWPQRCGRPADRLRCPVVRGRGVAFVPVIFWNALHVAADRRGPRRRVAGAGSGPNGGAAPRPLNRAAGRSHPGLAEEDGQPEPFAGDHGEIDGLAGGCRAPGPLPFSCATAVPRSAASWASAIERLCSAAASPGCS